MIKATIPAENSNCNLGSYEEACRGFKWSDVEKEFTWCETGNINIVHEAVDRWANDEETASRKALVFEKGGKIQEFTYSELKQISSQWANLFVDTALQPAIVCSYFFLRPRRFTLPCWLVPAWA